MRTDPGQSLRVDLHQQGYNIIPNGRQLAHFLIALETVPAEDKGQHKTTEMSLRFQKFTLSGSVSIFIDMPNNFRWACPHIRARDHLPYSGKFSGVLIFVTNRVRPPELNFAFLKIS